MGSKMVHQGFSLEFQEAQQEPEVMVFDLRLIYILSGEMSVHIGSENFKASSGDFFVINAGQEYGWKSAKTCLFARLEMNYKQFAGRLKTPWLYLICNSARRDFDADVYRRLRMILARLVREYTIPESIGFKRECLWYGLMDMLVQNFMFHVPESFGEMPASERILYVMQYVCANYWEELTMDAAARKMHLSMSAFSRWFKKQSGMNYGDFVQQVRMFHSVQNLLYTDKSVTDTALDSGFSSAAVFTKLFHKKYGMTPTDYRKKFNFQKQEKCLFVEQVRCSQEMALLNQSEVMQGINTILADTQQGKKWENCWNQAVNIEEAVELMSAKMQRQISRLHEQLGFKYIRLGNIFSEKMKLRKNHGLHGFNYDSLDAIIDFIISLGMHPFINLCDRERSVRLAINEALYTEGREGIFVCWEEMISVISETFRHFVMRYGQEEVSDWLVECWYDDREHRFMGLDENYVRGFQEIARVIKNIVPGIQMGGCGLALNVSEAYFRNIVKEWQQCHFSPDFISIYIYPYTDIYSQLSDFDYTRKSLELCQNILKQYGMDQVHIFVSEWNLSVSARNFYNDSCAKASMLLGHAASSIGKAKMYIYSMASDLSANYYDSSALLFGAPGLLSKDGLRKPVFYALLFMNRLSGNLLCSGPSYMITEKDHGEYQLLLFHAKSLGYKYYLKKEYHILPEDLEDAFEDMSEKCIELEIRGAAYREYYAKYELLDTENGSLLDAWLNMGATEAMTVKDIDYLESITLPRVKFKKIFADGNLLRFREALKPHEIQYIHIYPRNSWEK